MSDLRSRPTRAPVRVEIELPETEVVDGLAGRVARTLKRYCDHRVTYNDRERRETRALQKLRDADVVIVARQL